MGSPRIRRSRSSKVIDFGTNRKRVCDFLLVRHSNLGSILHRFGDIAGFLCSWLTPPLFHPNFGVFPLHQIAHVGVSPSRSLGYSAVKLFSKYSNMCENHTSTSQTDGQTDEQTDDLLWHNRALHCIALWKC